MGLPETENLGFNFLTSSFFLVQLIKTCKIVTVHTTQLTHTFHFQEWIHFFLLFYLFDCLFVFFFLFTVKELLGRKSEDREGGKRWHNSRESRTSQRGIMKIEMQQDGGTVGQLKKNRIVGSFFFFQRKEIFNFFTIWGTDHNSNTSFDVRLVFLICFA